MRNHNINSQFRAAWLLNMKHREDVRVKDTRWIHQSEGHRLSSWCARTVCLILFMCEWVKLARESTSVVDKTKLKVLQYLSIYYFSYSCSLKPLERIKRCLQYVFLDCSLPNSIKSLFISDLWRILNGTLLVVTSKILTWIGNIDSERFS